MYCPQLLIVNFQLLIENRLPKLRKFVKFAIIIELYFSQFREYQYYLTEKSRNLTYRTKNRCDLLNNLKKTWR